MLVSGSRSTTAAPFVGAPFKCLQALLNLRGLALPEIMQLLGEEMREGNPVSKKVLGQYMYRQAKLRDGDFDDGFQK